MAFSAVFFPSCTPRTQSSLLSAAKPHSLRSPTTLTSSSTLFPPPPHQATQKFLYQPLRMSPKIVVNPKRCGGKVKAVLEKGARRYQSVEVFSKEHLAVSLAHDVVELSKKFIHDRGAFSIALSSGPSIKYLKKLVEPPYVGSIDWSKWHFFWMEERVAPMDHAESNYKLAHDTFLSKVPLPRDRLNDHTIEHDLPADEAARTFEECVELWIEKNVIASSTSDHIPKFDLMLLGMGPDGHVASRFPERPAPTEHRKWVTVVNDAKNPPRQRISFTLPVITASSNIAMVVAGATKANAVYSALRDAEETETPKLVSAEGEVTWYLDKGAASKLFKQEIHMEKRY